MVDEESGRFIYYFMEFGAFIHGYAHIRKVIAIDGTHLSAYFVVYKENDASWGIFFNKLKAFFVDEPEMCVISDRHVSIANGLARHYPLVHHGVCMRHLGENLRINHHCSSSLICTTMRPRSTRWKNLMTTSAPLKKDAPMQQLTSSMK
ncbi:hypothetical protein P3S67_017564 [Capsicum chacoense]